MHSRIAATALLDPIRLHADGQSQNSHACDYRSERVSSLIPLDTNLQRNGWLKNRRSLSNTTIRGRNPSHAISCEPSLRTKFPANRKLTGNFAESGSTAIFESNQRADSIASSRIPCATEQGISERVSGKIFRRTGNTDQVCKRPLFTRLFCAWRTRSVLTGLFAK
jgi:hypothetical protein